MTGEFSVCQFFTNGTYEYVRRYVSAEDAVAAFKRYTDNVATKLGGIVERVIITDGGDFTNLEWRAGKGFSYDGVTYRDSPRTSAHPNVKPLEMHE
jgi:hypothetical protein